MKKGQAIKQARKEIGQIYQWGDGWMYAYWDEGCKAYREDGPWPYHVCRIRRSQSLIDVAEECMNWDEDFYPSIEYTGGNWTDYLD